MPKPTSSAFRSLNTCAGSSLRTWAADISIIFDLGASGEPTDIARDKDKMIGEAVWDEYLRKTGRKPQQRRRYGRNRERAFEIVR